MRNLKLLSLRLLSKKDGTARRVDFDPRTTVVLGENDTGKSSLIKSIYAAFGADPAVTHPDWKSLGVTTLVDFDVNSTAYRLLRSSNMFALFDDSGNKIWSTSGITSGLAPKLADILGIKLRMQSREGELITPPPAYFFAPFYVDQDTGWQRNWNSFSGMQQFENYRQSLALFHAGMRPNEYYSAQAAKLEAEHFKADLSKEREALNRTARRLQAGRRSFSIDLQPERFGDRIDRLTFHASALSALQDEVRLKLAKLHSARATLIEQVDIATASLAELDADFVYLRKSPDAEIVCPTCGTIHENNFSNKFSLAMDIDTCRTFVLEARQQLDQINNDIKIERNRFDSFEAEIVEIQLVLSETSGDIRLQDMLQSESERLIDVAFDKEKYSINAAIAEKEIAAQEALSVMQSYTDRRREKSIKDFFKGLLQNFAMQLQVPTLPEAFFKSLYANPPETGSDQPRALLAYYYAFAHTIANFSSGITGPFVLDSPVQQDQDPANANRIIEFALANLPIGMQLILGSVRLHDVGYDGHKIELVDKRRLLRSEEYGDVNQIIEPLMSKLL